MSSRWLVCLIVGLASQGAYAQTAPVAADDWGDDAYVEQPNADESGPIAPTAPPDMPSETPTARPYAGAVWTSGHWYWDGDQWLFKSGGWVERMPGYQYVNGYWAEDGDVWRWISGGWAQQGSDDVEIPVEVASEDVTATQAPPPLRVEVQSAAPAPDYTWAPGYWYWGNNGYEWVEGSWMEPPRPGLVFVSPHWTHRGSSWVFIGGGWASRGSVRVIVPVYRHAHIAFSFGRPNPFLRTWYRYPGVSWRYYGYGYNRYRHDRYRPGSYGRPNGYGYGRPGYYGGYRSHDASPGPRYNGRNDGRPGNGGRHQQSGGNSGGGRPSNGGGWNSGPRSPPGGNGSGARPPSSSGSSGWGGGSGGGRPSGSGNSSGVHQTNGGGWGGGSGGGRPSG
ncbi:YXWGXW repeat-containing protein, partial [Corallococcus terminator]|uniref:YXWGXW repeat-containing protein n=1 Tax=Corallococcus terminator TaxID=2316733 RepID=UPI001ABF4C8A